MKPPAESEMNAQIMRSMFSGTIHNMGNLLTMASLAIGELEEAHGTGSPPLIDMVLQEILPAIEKHARDGTIQHFLTEDPRGREMLQAMRELLDYQRKVLLRQRASIETLANKMSHLNGIISLQQQLLVGLGTTEQTDLERLADDALKMIGPSATRQGIDLVRRLKKAPPVLVDPSAMTQVLINLIKNAIEAFAEHDNQAAKCIMVITDVGMHNGSECACCIIQDNGPGMPADVAERAFDFGFTTKRRTRGERGVGLHFCRETVEAFKGTIEIQTSPGKGATFTIWLPLAAEHEDAASAAAAHSGSDVHLSIDEG